MITTIDADGTRAIIVDNPPVNALSFSVCKALLQAVEEAVRDAGVAGVVIAGARGTFSGGADVNDFTREPDPQTKTVRDVIDAIERSDKPFAAAIEGSALGGGLELALACDYRVAAKNASVGFPEVRLGLVPGAGGTQRLTRIVDVQNALQLMVGAKRLSTEEAHARGILDAVADGDPVALARRTVRDAPKRRISERNAILPPGVNRAALPFALSQAHAMLPAEERGGYAAHKVVDAIEAAVTLSFAQGIAREYRLFDECVRSNQSRALRHAFFAERDSDKFPALESSPIAVEKAGVVGAGTMGTGIAICFADAGIPVTVVEPVDEQVERAKQTIFGTYAHQVQRKRIGQEEAWRRGQSIVFASDYADVSDCDMVVEAVVESMRVKKDVFSQLDAVVKPQCILASNTSTLDIDAIADGTGRPAQVCGMHFFAPANVMKLVEIVRGQASSAQTLATAFAVGKRMRKACVLAGNAYGFIGNRMLFDYAREAMFLAEEGVPPHRVDAVLREFGFAMGPFAMFDLSGLDVAWRVAQAVPEFGGGRTKILDRLYEMKRFGQKTGAGYYLYDKNVGGGREPIRDETVETMFLEEAGRAGIVPRVSSDDEIVQRCVYALVNAGAVLLDRGIALRPGDEDVVWIYGYGFPPYRGGPMWYASEIGTKKVYESILRFREEFGDRWQPAQLLERLARSDAPFAHA